MPNVVHESLINVMTAVPSETRDALVAAKRGALSIIDELSKPTTTDARRMQVVQLGTLIRTRKTRQRAETLKLPVAEYVQLDVKDMIVLLEEPWQALQLVMFENRPLIKLVFRYYVIEGATDHRKPKFLMGYAQVIQPSAHSAITAY